jgi:hypothetical protein
MKFQVWLQHLFLFSIIIYSSCLAEAQDISISADTLNESLVTPTDTSTLLPPDAFSFSEAGKKNKVKKEEPKEPIDPESIHARKAAIWGIFPGGGQIYNKRWWKLPIVYGILGGMGYLLADNAISMRDYNQALDIRFSGGIDPYFGFLSDQQLVANRNFYRRNLQLSAVGFTALWGLSVIDAVVDAHMKTYDISDNLSFKWRPKISTVSNKSVPSLHLSLHL